MSTTKQATTDPYRININGVWYVKEQEDAKSSESLQTYRDEVDKESISAESFTFECDEYRWEATRLIKDDGEYYDDIDIEFTDKAVMPFLEELWDHNKWMVGVYQNNPDSMIEARKSMSEEGIKYFQAFLGKLVEMGWLKLSP